MTAEVETFTCSLCGGVYVKEWSDEEALQEYEDEFTMEAILQADVGVVCDDCYHKMGFGG